MILWIIAAVFAFFVKGLCGFANTLVFTSILSFEVNNASISPVELLLGYPGNLFLAWKERKKINWKICGPLSALVIKFLGENPGACPWDEAKKYFSKSLMPISSEYTLQI